MGTAQNKLGELFVDIGVGGLGKTLKGLNSVSASFLLAKNAATQMVRPIVDMTKQFGNSAVGLEKMKLTLGTTIEQAQRLQAVIKEKHLEGLETDLQRISDLLSAKEFQGLGSNFKAAMNYLKIPVQEYSGSLEDTLKLFDVIKERLDEVAKTQGAGKARFWSQMIGADYTNLAYALKRGVTFSDLPARASEMTQEQVDKLIKTDEDLKSLQIEVFGQLQKLFANNSSSIQTAIQKIINFVDNPKVLNDIQKGIDYVKEHTGMLAAAFIGNILGGKAGALLGVGSYVALGHIGEDIKKGKLPHSMGSTVSPFPYNPTNKGMSWAEMEKIQKTDIHITNNIQSTEPKEVANEVNKKFDDAMALSNFYKNK